jgi:hypothetical protein
MPFSLRSLAGLAYAGGFTLWRYRSETDSAAAIGAAGYFNAASHLVRAGDAMMVTAADGPLALAVTAAGSQVTTVSLRGALPPAGGSITAELVAQFLMARAIASDLPAHASLVTHLDASERLAFVGGVLPAAAAPVDFLLPSSGAPRGATESLGHSARPLFRANFDGAGRRALEFSAATPSPLDLGPFNFAGGLNSSDQAATVAAVFRLKAATSATTRQIVHVMPLDRTDPTHFPCGLLVLSNGNLMWRMRDNFTANTDATFSWTPNTSETLIMVGRHATGPTRNNRLAVRQGGATASITGTANPSATNFGAFPATSARLGGRRYNNGATEDAFFDGFLCELAIWNTDISDTDTAALINDLRAKWGVA